MIVDDEKLMAFADGELRGEEHAAVEAAVAADSALREKLASHQRLRGRLSAAFDGTLAEPVPTRLLSAAQVPPASNVVAFASGRAARWSTREWGAMAASLAAGLAIALGVSEFTRPPLAIIDGQLTARGSLARALDERLAADAGDGVGIGLSFRNRDGQYCRTFSLASTAGLACNDDGAWQVAMTAARAANGGEIRPAATDTPPEILAAVEALIEGDVFDAEAEAAARAREWRTP